MKTVLAAIALLALLVLACGKDEETSVTGATPRAVGRTEAGQGTAEAVLGFEVPAPVAGGPSADPASEAASTLIEIESVSGTVGQNATLDITMRDATEGLAGFKINVSVADPVVARIVGVDLSGFSLSDASPLPAAAVSLSAVDLAASFEGAFDRETIAILDLDLLTSGETDIVLRLIKLDDDNGNVVSAKAVHGRISVSDSGVRP